MTEREVSELFAKLGRKGGNATKKKYGKAYFSELAKKATQARTKKIIDNKK